MIWRASSAVATLRPNSRQIRMAPSICFTDCRASCACPRCCPRCRPAHVLPRIMARAGWRYCRACCSRRSRCAPCGVRRSISIQSNGLRPMRAAAIAAQGHVHRPHVDARADQPLDDLELVHVAGHEIGLDAGVRAAASDARCRRPESASTTMPLQAACTLGSSRWVPLTSSGMKHWDDVPQRRPGGDRDEFRLGVQLGQHVPRVVVEPLGLGLFGIGREGDRPADLDDHLRHGLASRGPRR